MTTYTPALQNGDDDKNSLNDMTPKIVVSKANSTPWNQFEAKKPQKNNNDELEDNKRVDISENLDQSSKPN